MSARRESGNGFRIGALEFDYERAFIPDGPAMRKTDRDAAIDEIELSFCLPDDDAQSVAVGVADALFRLERLFWEWKRGDWALPLRQRDALCANIMSAGLTVGRALPENERGAVTAGIAAARVVAFAMAATAAERRSYRDDELRVMVARMRVLRNVADNIRLRRMIELYDGATAREAAIEKFVSAEAPRAIAH